MGDSLIQLMKSSYSLYDLHRVRFSLCNLCIYISLKETFVDALDILGF